MKNAMEKFENAVNELMSLCKSKLGEIMFDEYMDDESLRMLRMCFNLTDASMNLMKEQNNMLIEMNEKLDRLTTK